MIVVDANVLAGFLISSEHPPLERRVYARDPDWIAPLLIQSEFRNLLATSIRKRTIAVETAVLFMEEVEQLLEGNEFRVSSPFVLTLAARSGCTAYGCEYVALAMDLGIPLVTRDREIIAAFPSVAVDPAAFLRG